MFRIMAAVLVASMAVAVTAEARAPRAVRQRIVCDTTSARIVVNKRQQVLNIWFGDDGTVVSLGLMSDATPFMAYTDGCRETPWSKPPDVLELTAGSPTTCTVRKGPLVLWMYADHDVVWAKVGTVKAVRAQATVYRNGTYAIGLRPRICH